jgi:hypothetical protein
MKLVNEENFIVDFDKEFGGLSIVKNPGWLPEQTVYLDPDQQTKLLNALNQIKTGNLENG